MMSRMLRPAAFVLAGILAACGPTASTGPTVSSVTVALQDASIPAGIGTTITATAKMSDGKSKDVTSLSSWKTSSATTGIVACTVSPCPVTTIAAGSVTFTATYGGKSATADLTVTAASLKTVTVSASRTSLAKGATAVLTARGAFSDASMVDLSSQVTWTSSDAAVTIAGTVATGAAVGTSTVTATLNGVSGTLVLTVVAAEPASLAISPSPLNVPVGSTQQLVALLTYTDGSSADVAATATWTSSNTAVAVVSTTGVVHALTQGTATISATSGALTDGETVTVGAPSVVSISITPTPVVLLIGGMQQLTAVALLSDTNTMDVTATATWTTDDATVATVSNGGLLSTVGAGNTTINATVGDISGTVPVTVTMASITSIAVAPATLDLPLGATRALTATAHLSNNTDADITATATWTSSSVSEVLVSAAGVVTASAQTTSAVTVTATVGDVSGTAAITVSAPVLTSLAIAPLMPSVIAGFDLELTATGTLTDATTEDDTTTATWVSSNEDIATVDSEGVVHGYISGNVAITATVGTVSKTVTATVTAPIISSISVIPNTASIPLGRTRQLAVSALMSNGTITTVTSTTSWSSDDIAGAIATISASGLVTTVDDSATTVTFTATVGTHTATSVITVLPPVLDSITINPPTVSLAAGLTRQLGVVGHLSDGTTEDDSVGATWASDDLTETFAKISATGFVTTVATRALPVTVTATFGGFTATSTVFVTPAQPVSITVSPDAVALPSGRTRQLLVNALLTDGNSANVTSQVLWSSDDLTGAIASVSTSGLVTAVATSATPVVVTATLNSLTATSTITVDPAVVEAVVVTPAPLSLAAGRTQQLAAAEKYSDATSVPVTATAAWSSSDEDIAEVSASGLLTTYAAGTVTIHALSSGVTGDLTVTVTAPVVDAIAMATTLDVALGASSPLVLNATLSDGNVENRAASATWSSSDDTLVTVSSTGVVKGIAETTTGAVITATLNGFTATTTVTVGPAVLTAVEVQPSPVSLVLGFGQQLTATARYSDGHGDDITNTAVWTASNGHATVSGTGLVTSVSAGTTVVRAEATAGGVGVDVDVTVLPAELTSITLSAPQTDIPAGATAQLSVVAHYTDGTSVDHTDEAAFSADVEAVGTVDATGLVTAVDVGQVVVSATLGGFTQTVTFNVVSSINSISLLPGSSLLIPEGLNVPFRIIAQLTDTTSLDVTALTAWRLVAPSAAVSLSTAGVVGAVTPGNADVQASIAGFSKVAQVKVTPPMIGLQIQPSTLVIPQGLAAGVAVVATVADSSTVDVTTFANWSTLDVTDTVYVTDEGLLRALGNDGVAVVFTATVGAFSADVSVTPVAALSSLEVLPSTLSLPAGLTYSFEVRGHLEDASTLDLTDYATWSTGDITGAIATISADGTVRGVAQSATPVTFTATVGPLSADTVVTVIEPELVGLTAAEADVEVAAGLTTRLHINGVLSDGSTTDVTSSITSWVTDNAGGTIATVDGNGVVSGVATSGTTVKVTASLGVFSAKIFVTVTPAVLVSISLTPADAHVNVSQSEQLSVDGLLSNDAHSNVTAAAQWDSSDVLTATVVNGEVACLDGGTVTITATVPAATQPGGVVTATTTVICDL